ncbi:hypothetical protein AHAS_Ahas19G0121400 [Arachis hypogaea]
MPFLAPIPRHQLALLRYQLHAGGVIIHEPMRGCRGERLCNILQFMFQPYLGIIVSAELQHHLHVCDMIGPLVSFECVECHPMDRVVCQYGYAQFPPLPAQDIPLDQHCYTLRGIHYHD